MRLLTIVVGLFLSLFAFSCVCTSTIEANEISVKDYMNQHPETFSIDEEGLLDLGNLGLHSLEGLDTFCDAEKVTTLDLRGNKLRIIPAGVFRNFTNLKTLWLKGNKITTIDEDALQGVDQLTWLSLSKNQLSSLPENLFKGKRQLQSIALRENQFNSFPTSLFQGLPRLKELYLEKNRIYKKDFRKSYGLKSTVALEFGHRCLDEEILTRSTTLLTSIAMR